MAYGPDLLPTDGTGMTASAQDEGNVVSRSCDDNSTTYWQNDDTTGWIKIDLGAGITKTVGQISLLAKDVGNGGSQFRAFTFAGSNDDSAYTTLLTSEKANNDSVEYFQFANSTGYRYYKLSATTVWAGGKLILHEWEMMEDLSASARIRINPTVDSHLAIY